MLYHLLYPLRDVISGFNVFRYITFRTAFAALTALIICFSIGLGSRRMRRTSSGSNPRGRSQVHQPKAGTTTMRDLSTSPPSEILWAEVTPTSGSSVRDVRVRTIVSRRLSQLAKANLGLTAKEIHHAFGVAPWPKASRTSDITTIRDDYVSFFSRAVKIDLGGSTSRHHEFTSALEAVNLTTDWMAGDRSRSSGGGRTRFSRTRGELPESRLLRSPGAEPVAAVSAGDGPAVARFLWFTPIRGSWGMSGRSRSARLGRRGDHQRNFLCSWEVFVSRPCPSFFSARSADGRRSFKMSPLHHHFELSLEGDEVVVRFWSSRSVCADHLAT